MKKRKININTSIFLAIFLLALTSCQQGNTDKEPVNKYPKKEIVLSSEKALDLATKIEQEVNLIVDEGLEVSLWASDSLVQDPIAISIDEKGRVYYTSATRQTHSEFDIRSHQNWMTASISFQTVEDRRAFLRKTFSETNEEGQRFLKDLNEDGSLDWKDLAVEKEQVWVLAAKNGENVATHAHQYLEDFGEEITDVANGIEYANGEVFIAVGPDLWRTKDVDGDGIADEAQSLSHGYAVHIGFSGHGMSGAIMGPDGRIWWGIGDIGMNVVDKEGKNWKYPNQGVIVRCETDGSQFEVYSAGLRNTHEFVFDEYGNLITEDNDGDHKGERERLLYLINGSETAWRINWQFGKYTAADNNNYKVWIDEKMGVPHWEGQAAYFLPPIVNYVNGPTGFVYNPGTALSPEWYGHFFVAEFRGSPANSPIHAFTLRPKGASFELASTKEIVRGLLPTGLDFGPDGALYFGDWIDGWGTKEAGRIWKVDVTDEASSDIRLETQQLIQTDFSKLSEVDLSQYLAHQDMRVRQKAQFALVKRGQPGLDVLQNTAQKSTHQLARIHGLWGIAQMARQQNMDYAKALLAFLKDEDVEIVAQAAKMLGDIKYKAAAKELIPLLQNPSLRLQMLVTEALGRMKAKAALQPILAILEANDNRDLWLRHAGMIALSRLAEVAPLVALKNHPSSALRIAAVVALRRMKAPEVAQFLKDQDEYIVTEAARAINDDFSIEKALPDLARVLEDNRFTNEALIRRAINANLRVGQPDNLQLLMNYAQRLTAPTAMRAEALDALSTWAKPSVFDRVDNRYRGEITRDLAPVQQLAKTALPNLLTDKQAKVQTAAAKAAGKLQLSSTAPALLVLLQNNTSAKVRKAALEALNELQVDGLDQALEIALADKDKSVRSTALEILPKSNIEEEKAVYLFQQILKSGTFVEQQAALTALGNLQGSEAVATLGEVLNKLSNGKAADAIQLDIIEAVEKQNNTALMRQLKAYQAAKPKDDALALFRETLAGGDRDRGQHIFYSNQAAQCVRCHAIFEYGGNAGPGLSGIGSRLNEEQLLESLIEPSAVLASAYGVVILKMKDEATISGIVLEETASTIRLKIGKADIQTIEKEQIEHRENIPSSMPSVKEVLNKREIRDLVAFLKSLKEEDG